jgi:hypothetical protein
MAATDLIQTGSATATVSGQVVIGAVAVDYASTGASGSNSFSLINQNTSATPNGKQFDKITSSSGSQSTVVTLTGTGAVPVPSYSAGNIIILREAASSFDPKKAAGFLSFFV